MKVVRGVLFALTWALTAAAGIYLVWAAISAPGEGGLDAWIARRPEAAAPIGILVVGLALLAAMSLRTRPAGADELRYTTEGGEVRIRMSALRDFAARLAGGLPGVETVRCLASREGDRVRIELHCRLPVGRSAVEYGRELQALIRTSLSEEIGIADVGDVCVRVTGFVTPNGRKAETASETPEVG